MFLDPLKNPLKRLEAKRQKKKQQGRRFKKNEHKLASPSQDLARAWKAARLTQNKYDAKNDPAVQAAIVKLAREMEGLRSHQ